MVKNIIDFAEWYSGMDRKKVEKAYSRYIKEVVNKSDQSGKATAEIDFHNEGILPGTKLLGSSPPPDHICKTCTREMNVTWDDKDGSVSPYDKTIYSQKCAQGKCKYDPIN